MLRQKRQERERKGRSLYGKGLEGTGIVRKGKNDKRLKDWIRKESWIEERTVKSKSRGMVEYSLYEGTG